MRMRPSSPWAVAMLAAAVAALGLVGSDALWLVPLGRLVAHGHVPHSVTFARAPTSGWHDVPAGAQVVFWSLYRVLGGIRKDLVSQTANLGAVMRNVLIIQKSRVERLQHQLKALSPVAILERGYALVFDAAGKLVKSTAQVESGDEISARLARGTITARVEKKNP